MSAINECPICMDPIEVNKNCVTTECGHCFHANCLMTSIAHNGFGCPYCRTAMAEEPEEDESTEYESVDEDEVDPLEDNDMLRGFRFFFNNVYGIEHDEDDVEEEIANEAQEQEDEEEEEPKPSPAFITQKLVEQGVTMEQLVTALLCNHEDQFNDNYSRVDDEIFGKLRIIISNYTPEQVATPQPVPLVTPPAAELDSTAQPKTPRIQATRRIMMHV